MSDYIQNATVLSSQPQVRQQIVTPNGQVVYARPIRNLQDEFVHQHKKNGLIERLYNGLKNLTGLGVGSKKVKKVIAQAQNGEISEDQARKTIEKYRNSQASSAQAVTDIFSVGAAGMTFFGIKNYIKKCAAAAEINEKNILKELDSKLSSKFDLKFNFSNFINDKQCLNFAKNSGKITAVAAGLAVLAGATVKLFSTKINRIGSKEFKVDKKDYNNLATSQDRAMYKADKKALKKARRKANFRNYVGGAVNGVMMPLAMLGGGIAGVPLYLVGNSLNRYFVSNHEEKNKSFNSYVENLKNDSLTHVAVTTALAIPMLKKAKFTSTMESNLQKAVNRLKDVDLTKSDFKGKTTYQELDEILMDSSDIRNIINNDKLSLEDKVVKLSDENIFAVKFKQISGDKSALSKALQEDCPPTRCALNPDGKTWNLTEIQDFVSKNLDGKYEVKQCLGVGTVAETYLAVGSDGKEVCLKILKKGIDEAKINADKTKFINIIKSLDSNKYTQEQKEYFIKNIDDLADGILKEVDFNHEAKAAEELVKSTKNAKVVKPIKVQNGIYVMEKADGISLKSLVELNMAYNLKDAINSKNAFQNEIMKENLLNSIPKDSKLGRLLKDVKSNNEMLEIVENYIKKVESRTPQYDNIRLSKDDFNYLIEEYEQVLVEQFTKVDKNGKTLHADIHPGNIFIDINALKNRKGGELSSLTSQLGYRNSSNIFTLIDTGNVVKQSMDQALDAINLTSYIERGNYKDIAQYVVKGAKGKLSEKEMAEVIEKELKELFTNETTELGLVTNEGLLSITSNIMRKHGVTPADTQLNLNKAKQSASNSLSEMIDQVLWMNMAKIDGVGSAFTALGTTTKDALSMLNKYKQMQSRQEKLNLAQMTKEQIQKFKNNPNMPAKNSEEYLFYKLKQQKQAPIKKVDNIF